MPQSRNITLLITAVVLICIFGVLYRLFGEKFSLEIKLPSSQTTEVTPSSNPQQEIKQLTFKGCDIKQEGNPLVSDVRTIGDKVVGTLRGNINHFLMRPADKTASASADLEVVAPKGDQTFNFRVQEEKGLVYNAVTQKEIKLSTLKPGQTVVISFNCFPQQNNLFKIAQIAVTSSQ